MGHRTPPNAIATGGRKTKAKLEPRYDALTEEVRATLHEMATAVIPLFGTDNELMLAIGNVLNKARAFLVYGQWLTWLSVELGNRITPNQAALYMRAHTFCLDYRNQGKNTNFGNLTRSSMYLLSGPDVPEELQHEILDRASREPVPYHEVKKAVDKALEPIRAERRAEKAKRGGSGKAKSKKEEKIYSLSIPFDEIDEWARQIVILLEGQEEMFNALLALTKGDIGAIFTHGAEQVIDLGMPPVAPVEPPPVEPSPSWGQNERESTVGQPMPPYLGR